MTDKVKRQNALYDLAEVINKHSLENESDTPDYILAEYLMQCLEAHAWLHRKRKEWYTPPDGQKHTHL